MAGAIARLGWPALDDFNGQFGDGHGALPMSSTLSGRVSAASAYLDGTARSRTKLKVVCGTTVDRLEFSKGRCTGAAAFSGKARVQYRARHTVLCAGAIHSPALLLRSGVGPADQLTADGIRVVMDVPGVGTNLQNHPVVYLGAHLARSGRQSPALRPAFNTALRFSSGGGPALQGDLQMLVLNRSSWHGLGAAVAGLGVCLMRPNSRGTVTLRPGNPTSPPDVRFRMLTAEGDFERLLVGFDVACDVMSDPAVQALRHEVFAAGYSRVVRRLNRPGLTSAALSFLLAKLLDGPDRLRSELLRWGVASGDTSEGRLVDASWRSKTVRLRSFGTFHAVGTCRMGREADPLAVTRPDGRVAGIEQLSVIDASIIPTIPRANTNLPVLMIAERCADLVLARDR